MSLRVTSMPGTHGPLLVAAMLPDVMGSMLDFRNERDGRTYRMYISGDTLVHEDLKEIPRRTGISIWRYCISAERGCSASWSRWTRAGNRSAAHRSSRLAIPIHYNDYDVFKDPLEEFVHAVERAGLKDKVRYLYHGESYEFVPRSENSVTPSLMGAPPLV